MGKAFFLGYFYYKEVMVICVRLKGRFLYYFFFMVFSFHDVLSHSFYHVLLGKRRFRVQDHFAGAVQVPQIRDDFPIDTHVPKLSIAEVAKVPNRNLELFKHRITLFVEAFEFRVKVVCRSIHLL